jgi:hypothetical protein
MSVNFLNIDGFQVQQHQEELDFIVSKAKGKTNYMEIGVYGGGTFNHVSKFVKGKHIAVDIEAKPDRDKLLKTKVSNFYSVVGDSHSYNTLDRVKEILKGETVDVLFIDGDHTAEGVERDFQMYKHLVTDGGVILFHDIIKSDFHAKCKCYVDKFWAKAPHPKDMKCVSKEWGGVGCIINHKVKYECHQIYYDAKSKKGLLPIFKPYNNSKEKDLFYFENKIIAELYENIDKIDDDYVGTTSWKFSDKTKMDTNSFTDLVEATNCNYDVILFPMQNHLHDKCMIRNKNYYNSIYQLCLIFDKENILPFKMEYEQWTCSYNNYWIAKKETYKHYCETTLMPAMRAFKENKVIADYTAKNRVNHGGKNYPITPFLLEVLMGFYVNKFSVVHKIITPDPEPNLLPDECWCKVLNKALVPEGTEYIKLKRPFAEQMQVNNDVKIMDKWR